MVKLIFSLLFILNLNSFCCADTIILKSGKKVDGKILEKSKEYIKVDLEGLPITYFVDEIEKIVSEPKAEAEDILAKQPQDSFVNKDFGISIMPPAGWYAISDDMIKAWLTEVANQRNLSDEEKFKFNIMQQSTFYLIFSKNPIESTPEVVSKERVEHPTIGLIVSKSIGGKTTIPLAQFIDNFIATNEQKYKGFKIIEPPREVELQGNKWVRLIYINEDLEVKFLRCFFQNKNLTLYEFSGGSKIKDFEDSLPIFEKSLDTIKID